MQKRQLELKTYSTGEKKKKKKAWSTDIYLEAIGVSLGGKQFPVMVWSRVGQCVMHSKEERGKRNISSFSEPLLLMKGDGLKLFSFNWREA